MKLLHVPFLPLPAAPLGILFPFLWYLALPARMVFVVGEDHKVTIRPVAVRQSLNAEALIDKGLSVGETVVVRGQYRLSPGTLVSLADPHVRRVTRRQSGD